jgi:hypothetical protein
MSTPKFTLGAATLEFTGGIQLPGRRPLEKIQARDRTAAGSLQVEDLGVASIRRFPLVIRGIDSAKMAELETWWNTIAEGGLNSFTYSDEEGVDYTVLWTDDQLDFTQLEPDIFEGEINLEVVG